MLAFWVTPLMITRTISPWAGTTPPAALSKPVRVTLDVPTDTLWLARASKLGVSLVTVSEVAVLVAPFSTELPA